MQPLLHAHHILEKKKTDDSMAIVEKINLDICIKLRILQNKENKKLVVHLVLFGPKVERELTLFILKFCQLHLWFINNRSMQKDYRHIVLSPRMSKLWILNLFLVSKNKIQSAKQFCFESTQKVVPKISSQHIGLFLKQIQFPYHLE